LNLPGTPSTPIPRDQSDSTGGRRLDPEEIELLLERGRRPVSDGDLTSARLLFQRAAEAGDAALALGATYDPAIIGRLRVIGVSADIDRSRAWYEKAAGVGSRKAAHRLEDLSNR
jgi:TPR repeat protein